MDDSDRMTSIRRRCPVERTTETLTSDAYICMHMGTEYTSIRVNMEAYHALERRKRPDESFSDVIKRLAEERPITDLAGLLSDEEVASIRAARKTAYEDYTAGRNAGSDTDGRDQS